MPIYAFECDACGHSFDRLQRLSDPDPDVCEKCGAPGVRRAVTAASFRLKGGGWYETDFKGDKDKKRNLVESGSAADSGGDSKPAESKSAENKVDSKPAETAAPKPAESKPAATP